MKKNSKIEIVNIKDKLPYNIYIGRTNRWESLEGSIWGNPFRMKNESQRLIVIDLYRKHVLTSPLLMSSLPDLKGKILGCWCKPKNCHGDVLIELVNKYGDYPKPILKAMGLLNRILIDRKELINAPKVRG